MNTDHRSVALIGSSGGGTATLGHTKPIEFIQTIENELSSFSETVDLGEVIFVSLDNGKGMDGAKGSDPATLLHISDGTQRVLHGSLDAVNDTIKQLDANLAEQIKDESIHALICVSCRPSLFDRTLHTTAEKNLPVTGTGGTSLSDLSSNYGIQLVGNAGGSVATTPLTKAISFSHALAKSWGLNYSPWSINRKGSVPSWRSVLNSSLPAFWAVALCKRVVQKYGSLFVRDQSLCLEFLESYALPITCSVMMAASRRDSSGVMMGAILAATSCRRTILGGLSAGWMTAWIEERLLYLCIINGNVPATMTNLLTTGLVGILSAVIIAPIAVYLAAFTDLLRSGITSLLDEQSSIFPSEASRILFCSMAGSIFCYGSKVGWYHSIFLPIILLEMEIGDPAILGAMDQLTLVLVSAGICSATRLCRLVSSADDATTSLVKRGLRINLMCGDFIEVCYPIMEENIVVNFGAYLASACSVAILTPDCKSSAYLPLPAALWLADDWKHFGLASIVAMGISFTFTLLSNVYRALNRKRVKC